MKLEAYSKVDVNSMLIACSTEQAMKVIKLADVYQYNCDFTYEVVRVMIKRLEKELGKGNEYTTKLKEMLK